MKMHSVARSSILPWPLYPFRRSSTSARDLAFGLDNIANHTRQAPHYGPPQEKHGSVGASPYNTCVQALDLQTESASGCRMMGLCALDDSFSLYYIRYYPPGTSRLCEPERGTLYVFSLPEIDKWVCELLSNTV